MKKKQKSAIALILCLILLTSPFSIITAGATERNTPFPQGVQELLNVVSPKVLVFDEHKNQLSQSYISQKEMPNLRVSIEGEYAYVESTVTGKMKLRLYEGSVVPLKGGISYLGVPEEVENPDYGIANFRIETQASIYPLLTENRSLLGTPVIYCGIWDKANEKIYYMQEQFSAELSENVAPSVAAAPQTFSKDELQMIELRYVTLSTENIPSFTVNSDHYSEQGTTVTTNIGSVNYDHDPNASETYASEVVPGVPNSAYYATALNMWQDTFCGWDSEHGYALYAQYYTGSEARIIYTLPYLLRRSKNPGTGAKDHTVYFKLNSNSLVSYVLSNGDLTATEGSAAKCKVTMWARTYTDKSVITQRATSSYIAPNRIQKAAEVAIISLDVIGTGLEIVRTLFDEEPMDTWNVFGSNYDAQVANGEVVVAYRYVQPNLKTKGDRAHLAISTHNAQSFDIGCAREFYFY